MYCGVPSSNGCLPNADTDCYGNPQTHSNGNFHPNPGTPRHANTHRYADADAGTNAHTNTTSGLVYQNPFARSRRRISREQRTSRVSDLLEPG